MRIAEMLQAIANWLESPDNEAILLAEYDNDCLKIVAESCVEAAFALKKAAETVDAIEPMEESKITPESIQDLANLATAFDASGDLELKKQASVIDELLLTIAAPPGALNAKKAEQNLREEQLKKKYEECKKSLDKSNKVADSIKAIDKSNMTKEYKIMEAPLSTRYCPDHPGTMVSHVGENTWQCELDKKVYNFETGFTLDNGDKVPGGNVAEQTKGLSDSGNAVFDTRQGRLQNN